mgnify:CR=1 FL=1
MFLTKQDLSATVYPEIVALMSRYTDVVIEMNFNLAEGDLQSYLASRYDIGAELAKEGADRNAYLLSLAITLAIYYLYTLQETIPAHRTKMYDQAIAVLGLIRDGKQTLPGVDPAPTPESPVLGQIGYGSNARRPSLVASFPGNSRTPV